MCTQKFEENKIDITLEEFDELDGNHEFSERYNKKKAALLGAVRKRERSAKKPYYRVAVAAVLALVMIPTTVFAATKVYNVYVEKNGFEARIKVEANKGASEEEKLYVPVKVELTYLPQGSVLDPNSGKYDVPSDEGEARYAHAVTPAELYKMDKDEAELLVPYTIDRWEYDTEDRKVMVFQKSAAFEFDKEVYVFFENYNYIQHLYLGYGISDDEVKKIAEGVKLIETTEDQAKYAFSMTEMEIRRKQEAEVNFWSFAKQKKSWHKIGEEIEGNNGYQYKSNRCPGYGRY